MFCTFVKYKITILTSLNFVPKRDADVHFRDAGLHLQAPVSAKKSDGEISTGGSQRRQSRAPGHVDQAHGERPVAKRGEIGDVISAIGRQFQNGTVENAVAIEPADSAGSTATHTAAKNR
ncbi:hypothetical protein EV131_103352 [Rhizobium laguerreae]|uniref:Uncharacterized protein n=1 Tax=Rhizobium laguerreae TaxID=1076926 RepID=A0AAX2QS45_9HYPH|nr:hypothetical protein EV131_103352 [Rhizobium laguerreae]